MARILKLVFLLIISQVALGQAPSNYTNINGRYRWIAGMFDSTFSLPKGTTPSLRTGGSSNPGALFYNTSDSSVYSYTGTQWIKLRGSINPSDTTNKYVTQVYKKNGSDSVFYVKGGIHTWAFNDSTGSAGGGGGGKIYYLNGGVSMGTFGGFTMYELGDTAVIGTAANFTRATTGNIANFITDVNKPGLLQIPAGVWTIDAWMSETGGGANHAEIYAKVEKWNGSVISTIATSPIEQITEGNSPNLYTWSVSIPTTTIAVTDRIIIQFYIQNTNGKTVTLYTQNGYVGEVHTTFTTGIGALNGLTAPAQYLVTGTSGTDFNISSATATHTFNLPTASATNRGALSTTDWSTFNNKIGPSDTASMLSNYFRINGVGLNRSGQTVLVDTLLMSTRAWRQKGVDSVASLINTRVSGTTNRVAKFTGTNTIGNSSIADSSSSVAMTISSTGNVGLGSTPNNWTYKAFQIYGASLHGNSVQQNDAGVSANAYYDSGWKYYGNNSATQYRQLNGAHAWNIAPVGTAGGTITFTQAMTLDASGNLGLGVTPSAWSNIYKALQLGPQTALTNLNSTYTVLGTNWYDDGSNKYIQNGYATMYYQNAGQHVWQTAASGTAGNAISFTQAMTLDASGRLGIGTTSPTNKLDVYGTGGTIAQVKDGSTYSGVVIDAHSSSTPFTRWSSSGTGKFEVGYYSNQFYFNNNTGINNTNAAMVITSGGNVGIGTTNPNAKLVVAGTTNAIIRLTGTDNTAFSSSTFWSDQAPLFIINNTSSTANTVAGIKFELGNTNAVAGIGAIQETSNTAAGLIFTTGGSSTGSNNPERMRITSGGNVGIGTSSPSAKLEVNGNIYTTSNTNFILFGTNAGTNPYIQGGSDNGLFIGNNNLARIYIASGGNVGIGTTSPAYKLSVLGSALANMISWTDNVNNTGYLGIRSTAASLGADNNLIFETAATERMRITSGGELLVNTTTDAGAYYVQVNGSVYATAYYESSDLRLKNVFSESRGSDGINTIRFKWKDGRDSLTHIGYAAQQVEKVLPDAVKTNTDGYKTINYDEVQTFKIQSLEKEVAELKELVKKLMDKK